MNPEGYVTRSSGGEFTIPQPVGRSRSKLADFLASGEMEGHSMVVGSGVGGVEPSRSCSAPPAERLFVPPEVFLTWRMVCLIQLV